jgi:hypothetical protein
LIDKSNSNSGDTLDDFSLTGAAPSRTTMKRRESPNFLAGNFQENTCSVLYIFSTEVRSCHSLNWPLMHNHVLSCIVQLHYSEVMLRISSILCLHIIFRQILKH